jgi:hypothetical protein
MIICVIAEKHFCMMHKHKLLIHNGNCKLCNKIAISQVSQELFNTIYNLLKNKANVYFGSLNYEKPVYLTIEDKLQYKEVSHKQIDINYKHKFLLDFCQNNKVIEFNR